MPSLLPQEDVKPLHELLSTNMNRREFLVHVGGVLLAVVGVSGLVRKITDPFSSSKKSQAKLGSYGGSTYGGGPAVAADATKRSAAAQPTAQVAVKTIRTI